MQHVPNYFLWCYPAGTLGEGRGNLGYDGSRLYLILVCVCVCACMCGGGSGGGESRGVNAQLRNSRTFFGEE